MSYSAKIEMLVGLMVDGTSAAFTTHKNIAERLSNEMDFFQEQKRFITWVNEKASADSDTLSLIVSTAAISDLLLIIKRSLMADGDVSADELVVAQDLLQDTFYRYAWLDDYSHYDPLVDPSEVGSLLVQWEQDTGFLGGNFAEGATVRPFAALTILAAIAAQDASIYDSYAQAAILAQRIILNAGGMTLAEQKQLSDATEMHSRMKQLIVSTISLAGRNRATTHLPNAPTANQTHKVTPDSPQEALNKAMRELDSLVGVPEVKAEVRKLTNFLKIRQQRLAAGLPQPSQSLHFIFTGNPGTGKTTVARIVSRILHGFEILDTPTFVETDKSMLVGGYLGQTAIKTSEVIDSALNGVLFIDEAYTLARKDSQDSYGQEAIDTLLKRMEDLRDRLVVIAAGYPKLMRDFIATNPGLESRFTRFIHFEDYHVSDLCKIFENMCASQSYKMTPQARAHLAMVFNRAYAKKDEKFGNARYVRNVYEKTLGNHADRLAELSTDITREMLATIEAQDIPMGMALGLQSGYDVSGSKWNVVCPGCDKLSTVGIALIGSRVTCKCGASFRCPWWNLSPESLPSLTGFKKHERPEDLVGYDVKLPSR